MPPTEAPRPAPAPDADAPAAKLDARGLLCPLPVLLTAREIAKLPPGARLLVEGDDRGILEDLPAWCAASGHRLVEIGETAEPGTPPTQAPADAAPPGRRASSGRTLIRAVVEKASR